jgi:hypothetical protein
MVIFLNVKIDSVPIERGFFLTGIAIAINYILLTMLLLLNLVWRFKTVSNALMKVDNYHDKTKVLKKLKSVLKMLSKLSELLESASKYFLCNNIFLFTNLFMIILIMTFLGYDILVHDLGTDDVILFFAFVVFSVSTAFCSSITILTSTYFSKCFSQAFEKINLIFIKFNDRKIQKICELGILQLQNSRKEISCGFFAFNWKHVFLMLSSFFSYLIMMIQFDYMITTKNIEVVYGK